jgi:hypothetical protein
MEGSGGINPSILYLSIKWRVVIFTPWSLYARKRFPRTHGLRGRMATRVSLDTLDKIKLFCLYPESNQDSAAVYPVA